MFNLDREIHAWCRSIYPHWWDGDARMAELTDHLYCETERLCAEGLTEEEAFLAATERMGNVEALITEHAKNSWQSTMSPQRAATLIIVISLICAGAIILSSYLLVNTPYEPYSQMVMYFLIALWFIPYSLLSMRATGEQGSLQSEYAYIKRKVSNLFNRG